VLSAHDVTLRRTTALDRQSRAATAALECQWQALPFEGPPPHLWRRRTQAPSPAATANGTLTNETLTFPAGSVVVPLDQRLSKVAIHLA